jgi:anhydro-N-acetylmuramic acid kinase
MTNKGMTNKGNSVVVAGVMSGTSADGVDVALCRIGPGSRAGDPPQVKPIGHLETRYPKAVRATVLRAMEGEALPAAEMSRLNWQLGEIYADCVEKAAAKFGVKVGLVGCHGQTVHHETQAVRYLGAAVRSTWQMGEGAVIAERLRCPVVSDFRPADLAAGGQGAPLVPMLDWCVFRQAKKDRVLLNLGGIANLTWLPAGCGLDVVKAFDTGPGNMVIDACMQRLYGRPFDKDGVVAAKGRRLDGVLDKLIRMNYFSAPPPKSCGREQFGTAFVEQFLKMCKGAPKEDVLTTATELTAKSVCLAYERYCWLGLARPTQMLVAGGGARNATLMRMLAVRFAMFGVRVAALEEVGMAAQAKEGVAFALLAWLTWNGLAGNVPAATGAARPVVLGKVSQG